jgi:hypothetical protein
MMPDLLWRCPLCATNDVLVHKIRLFRPDRVDCGHCRARWRVRRVPGDDYYLRLIRRSEVLETVSEGAEKPLKIWYELMKSTLQLVPISDPAAPLDPDEVLYLASKRMDLVAEETDPRFFPGASRVSSLRPKEEVRGRSVGPGRLFLTNRRLIWQGIVREIGEQPWVVAFPLEEIQMATPFFGVVLNVGTRLYMLYFPEESMLKWVTYLGQVSEEILLGRGHQIKTAPY